LTQVSLNHFIYLKRQTTYEYRVDTTFYDKAEYMFSKQPEYFCLGKCGVGIEFDTKRKKDNLNS